MHSIPELTDNQIKITKKAYNSCAKKYSKEIEWEQKSLENSSKNIIKPLLQNLPKGSSIAHVGCGTGRDIFLLNRLGYFCEGYDVSSGMLKLAKSKNPTTNFFQHDISKSPILQKKYDAILAESVLSFVKHSEITNSIKNMVSGLKDGGILFLGFKDGGNMVRNDDLIGDRRYFICYDEGSIKEILDPFDFEVLKVEYVEDMFARFHKYINFIVKK